MLVADDEEEAQRTPTHYASVPVLSPGLPQDGIVPGAYLTLPKESTGRQEMNSVVYLAENLDRSLMKVGTSSNPGRRVRSLACSARHLFRIDCGAFRLIMSLPGNRRIEQNILGALAAADCRNLKGREWFAHSDIIEQYFIEMGAIRRGPRNERPPCGSVQLDGPVHRKVKAYSKTSRVPVVRIVNDACLQYLHGCANGFAVVERATKEA